MQIWGNTAQTGSASSPLFTSLEKRCCRLKTLNRSEEWRNADIENAKQIFLKSCTFQKIQGDIQTKRKTKSD